VAGKPGKRRGGEAADKPTRRTLLWRASPPEGAAGEERTCDLLQRRGEKAKDESKNEENQVREMVPGKREKQGGVGPLYLPERPLLYMNHTTRILDIRECS
jgi:hypothetical protein